MLNSLKIKAVNQEREVLEKNEQLLILYFFKDTKVWSRFQFFNKILCRPITQMHLQEEASFSIARLNHRNVERRFKDLTCFRLEIKIYYQSVKSATSYL